MPAPSAPRLIRGPCHQALRVVQVGTVSPDIVERGVALGREVLGFAAEPERTGLPLDAFLDARRGQHRADLALAALREFARTPHDVILGLTSADLFLPILTYVFGAGEVAGRTAIVSTMRLEPSYYGLPADSGLTLERAEKEILHELGHVLGLRHCADGRCAMSSAHEVGRVDLADPSYCPPCRAKILGCPA